MEYFSTQPQWQLPPPSSASEQLPTTNAAQAATDDWQKHLTQNNHPTAGPSTLSHSYSADHGPAVDLPDPTLHFSELPVQNPTSPPQQLYWQYQPPPDYYFNQFSHYPLPVTSYSSLNGATVTPQQQHPLDIDPSLPSGSSSNEPLNLNGTHSRMLAPFPYSQQEQVFAINPSALHTTSSPTSLFSPQQSTSSPRTIPKADLKDVLKQLLTPSNLAGSSAVAIIVRLLGQYGLQDIAPDVRFELFSKLTVQADDQFFRAWVDNSVAMDITRNWLKAGIADEDNGQLRATINPILGALGRMRFSIASLKDAKLGKIILKLTKDSNSATRDLSLALEKKWRSLLSDATPDPVESASSSLQIADEYEVDPKAKKRKLVDASTTRPQPAPPAKKLALASTPTVKQVRKEPKVVVTSVKDAKSDSSFFSKPKAVTAKPKLPSFKKSTSSGSAALPSGQASNDIAQPSSIDPFKDALMTLKRNASPNVEPKSTPSLSQSLKSHAKAVNKSTSKKRVSFAPDGQLEQIRFIEKAIYDDDPEDINRGTQNIRDLDRGEGAAMHVHAHMFEEQVDWMDLLQVDGSISHRGSNSSEKLTQEEREKGALSAVYLSASQIPESPAEPSELPPDDPDSEIKQMMVGKDIEMCIDVQDSQPSIPDLMAKIQSTLPAESEALLQQSSPSMDFPSLDFSHLAQNLTFEQLQLLSQVGLQGQQNWTHSDYSNMPEGEAAPYEFDEHSARQWENADGGWSGGRGRGRGRGRGTGRGRAKSRPCSFFAQGRCRYGEHCDFSHDQAP